MAPAHVAEGGGGKTPRSLAPAPVWNNTVCQAQAHVFTRKRGNGVLGVEESTDILGRGQQGDGEQRSMSWGELGGLSTPSGRDPMADAGISRVFVNAGVCRSQDKTGRDISGGVTNHKKL